MTTLFLSPFFDVAITFSVSTISDEKTNIRNVDAKSLSGNRGLISLSLDIKDRTHMDRVMARLRKISGVDQVERVIR